MFFNDIDYVVIDHTADLGIKVRGNNLNRLFENAGKALIDLMLGRRPPSRGVVVPITLSGLDLEDLLVRWLEEIIYLFDGEKRVATVMGIDAISPTHLDATIAVVPFDASVHRIEHAIKAATYHQIRVAQIGDQWEARVIFDV